jgi:hypothetical protein
MDTENAVAEAPAETTAESSGEPEGFTRKASASSDPKFYTEEDLAKAREQEKSKLYKRLETMKETVERLERESRERAEAEEAKQREIEKEEQERQKMLEQQAESEMSAKDLLAKKEAEWQQQMQSIQQQMEAERALREREQQFAQLMEYRQQVVQQYQDRVAPELLDLIQGDSPEAIQQSADDMAARTERILAQTQEAMQNVRQQTPTARVSLPASGENSGSQQSFTAEDIRQMSMADYAKQRQRLLGEGADGPKNRGLFG